MISLPRLGISRWFLQYSSWFQVRCFGLGAKYHDSPGVNSEGEHVVDALVQWETDSGPVVVEVDSSEPGFQGVSRQGELIHAVEGKFESALQNVRNAAESALRIFRDEVLKPDSVDIEFGVKLNAAAGAVIAKTAAEAHLVVRLHWDSGSAGGHEDG
jgi:hypothetical protein